MRLTLRNMPAPDYEDDYTHNPADRARLLGVVSEIMLTQGLYPTFAYHRDHNIVLVWAHRPGRDTPYGTDVAKVASSFAGLATSIWAYHGGRARSKPLGDFVHFRAKVFSLPNADLLDFLLVEHQRALVIAFEHLALAHGRRFSIPMSVVREMTHDTRCDIVRKGLFSPDHQPDSFLFGTTLWLDKESYEATGKRGEPQTHYRTVVNKAVLNHLNVIDHWFSNTVLSRELEKTT